MNISLQDSSSYSLAAARMKNFVPEAALLGVLRFLGLGLFVSESLRVGFVVWQPSRVLLSHQRRTNKEVGGGAVASHGDIPHYSQAQQCLNVWVVRQGLKRVPEEDEEVYCAFGDACADLLVSA